MQRSSPVCTVAVRLYASVDFLGSHWQAPSSHGLQYTQHCPRRVVLWPLGSGGERAGHPWKEAYKDVFPRGTSGKGDIRKAQA